MATWLVALAAAVLAPVTEAASELSAALAADGDAARGAEIYRTCAACHGDDGGGVRDGTIPAIGGMPVRLVVRQLVNFRREQRNDIRMEHFADASHLATAQEIADVAAHVASLERRTPAGIGDGRALDAGARAYFRACQACHGALGRAGRDGMTPALAGQHQAYLERQLRDAAAGRRPSMNATHRAPLRALRNDELVGITDYLSRMTPEPRPLR
jgi:cytochrome c oxidase subunit 2